MTNKTSQSIQVSDNLIVLPTSLRHILSAFRNSSVSQGQQAEKFRPFVKLVRPPAHRGHRMGGEEVRQQEVLIELRRTKFARDGVNPEPGKHVATARMGHAAVASNTEELINHCLDTLASLNTDCLLTLFAMIQVARENNGTVSDDIADIGRRRGWKPGELDGRGRKTAKTRRERLREHVRLLSEVEFFITELSDNPGHFVTLPLFQYLGSGGKHGSHRNGQCFYNFHPALWKQMTAKQRAVFLDNGVLTADPRQHEWPFRLAWYMSSRWAPSWVAKTLYSRGGRLTERLGVLLVGGGIEFHNQLHKQGRKWLRRTFRKALDKLQKWVPRSVIGGYEIEEHAKSPLQDRVTFWPSEIVANQLTASRSKSIAKSIARQSGRTTVDAKAIT